MLFILKTTQLQHMQSYLRLTLARLPCVYFYIQITQGSCKKMHIDSHFIETFFLQPIW